MPFMYDPVQHVAVDAESNSRVRLTFTNLDAKNFLLYEFARDGFSVRFEVYNVVERRRIRWKNEEREQPFHVCSYIIQSSLRSNFFAEIKTLGRSKPGEEDFEKFREMAKEGLFAYVTRGGA